MAILPTSGLLGWLVNHYRESIPRFRQHGSLSSVGLLFDHVITLGFARAAALVRAAVLLRGIQPSMIVSST